MVILVANMTKLVVVFVFKVDVGNRKKGTKSGREKKVLKEDEE